jgi:two-component system chemotaxis sensor kinase CheA
VGAELRGDRLRVTVADDGAGLDADAIRAELVRRGRVPPRDAQELGEALFETRLSTRATPTPLSGRGVGLDIVRASCARVGGRVQVSWESGKGTRFSIECPLTLASLRVLMVSVGSHAVAIPVEAVERAKRVSVRELTTSAGRTSISTADDPVPVVRLSDLLAPLGSDSRPTQTLSLVLLRDGTRRLAVAVDELLEVRELAVRPLRGVAADLPTVRGAALLETGAVALVIEPAELLIRGLAPDVGPLTLPTRAHAHPPRRRVLVVDDSTTTRLMACSILEDAGYEVLPAKDGEEGWRLLQELVADLVVADVEMPNMDGVELCQAIRSSQRFAQLPVVLVSGREKAQDRTRGLAAGADAYIAKSGFDARALLQTIERLLRDESPT